VGDLRELAATDERLVDAALQAVTDLADGRRTGKRLGLRPATGDLSMAWRLRFDLEGERPQRFRVVYRLLPDADSPVTIEVLSIGLRGGSAAYHSALERLEG
jgi:hypothetical protein